MDPTWPTLELARGAVDLQAGVVRTDRGSVGLTELERELLGYLAAHAGRAVAREELLAEVWGYREGTRSRTVEVTVGRLRAKIEEDPANPAHLVTVRGAGYRWVAFERADGAAPVPLSAASRARAFPRLLEPLIDRVTELRAARAHLVHGVRWLSVTGSPGIGKTWFGRALVGEIADAGRADVVYVDLTDRCTRQDVGEALELALQAPIAAWTAEDRSAVWLIDAADALDQGAVRLLESCLHEAQRLAIVATAQAPVGAEGEIALPLPPLAPTDGAALLRRRLEAAGVAPPTEPLLLDLADRLEGLPLAIDVATARLAVHSPDVVALTDLIAAPHPRRTGRSLAEVVGAAIERLDRATRAGLASLGVFAGSFDLDAAEAVAGASAAEVLGELHRRSLARRLPDRSFRLAPAVRAIAGPPDPGAARRLADHLERRLARVLAERTTFAALRPYRQDLPLLLALDLPDGTVHALARLLSTLHVRYGPPVTPPILTARFDAASPALRAQLAVRLSDLARVRGDVDEGDRIAAIGLACGPPPHVRVALLRARIQAAVQRGDTAAATAWGREAVDAANTVDDLDTQLIALETMGGVIADEDPEAALGIFHQLVATALVARNPDAALLGETNAAWACAALGRFAEGLHHVEVGLARNPEDHGWLTAAAHAVAGLLHAALGDRSAAEAALASAERIGAPFSPPPPLGLLDARALLACRRGEDPEVHLAALERAEPGRAAQLRGALAGSRPRDALDAVFAAFRRA